MTSGGKKHGRPESRGNIYWLTNSVVDSDERLIAAATGCDVRYDYVVMKQVMFMVALRCKPMFPMFVQVPQNLYKLCKHSNKSLSFLNGSENVKWPVLLSLLLPDLKYLPDLQYRLLCMHEATP